MGTVEHRVRLAVVLALVLLAPAVYAKPMAEPPGTPPAAVALHQRGIALEAQQPREALAVYEEGARQAINSPIRAMFFYEEARLLVRIGTPEQIGVALDRLVAEPAHPSLVCDAPAPSASGLYYGAGRYAAALSLRAALHEQQGRFVEAFREETAAHSLTPEVRGRVTTLHIDLDEPGRILFDGAVFGPADRFTCFAVGEKPREIAVNARSVSNALGSSRVTTKPGDEEYVRVSFKNPTAPATTEPAKGGAFLYLSAGLGGGYTNASGHGAGGDGRMDGRIWLLGDDKHSSLLVQHEAMFGVGSDGPLGTLRFQLEYGGRLPLYDEGRNAHGLFLRAGLAGRALLDRGVQTGSFDLPVGSAGYAFYAFTPALAGEVGFRGGATLLGGYAVDAGSRHFEIAPTYGPFASLHVGPVHLDGQLARIDRGGPVDYAHGSLCFTWAFFGLCGALDAARADVLVNHVPERTSAVIAGGTLDLVFDTTGTPYGLAGLLKGR